MEIKNGKLNALIVLHEIYGINRFIEDICVDYAQLGYDVFCPNMLERECFPYDAEQAAYQYFIDKAGFDRNLEIGAMAFALKDDYEHVFLLGFSAGATIAWKVASEVNVDGVVCCYGSRIRDFLERNPKCPTYLILAKETSFDVNRMIEQLYMPSNLTIRKIPQNHGFMDQYCRNYDKEAAEKAMNQINRYFRELQKKK
jgi:dienelactone hydrolase